MSRILAYTRTAIALHWVMALLIFIAFPLGVIAHEMALSPDKLRLMSYHKWLGVTIFALLLVRLLWRYTHTPQPRLDLIPHWQEMAATIVHVMLYVLLLAIPVSGWLMSSAKGFQTVYLGVWPLPDMIGKDKDVAELLGNVHRILNFSLLGIVILHMAAALKHHFIDKDGTLKRMLPFLDRSANS